MMTKIRSQRGGALILAIIAFMVIAGAGTALFSLTLRGHKTTLGASNGDVAFHIAEGGVDDTLNKLAAYALKPNATGADFAVIGQTQTVNGVAVNLVKGNINRGTFYAMVEPPYAGLGTYKITSVGTFSTERRAVETYVVAQNEDGSFAYGMFGDVTIDAGGSLVTDGYKSSKDTYANQLSASANSYKGTKYVNPSGHIGSNGTVDVGGSALIFGNATPGPGNSVSGGGYVSGSKAPATNPYPLADITYTPTGSSLTKLSGTVTGPASYQMTSLSLGSKDEVVISGDVTLYVSGDIKITAQSKLILENGATLKIYQGSGGIDIHGGADMNGGVGLKSGIPADFQIWSNSSSAIINGGSGFYGAIYAPKAAVKLNGNADFFGGIVGSSIKPTGSAKFHYDEDLGAVSVPKVVFKVKSSRQYVP